MVKNEKVDDDTASKDTLYMDDSGRGHSSVLYTVIVVAIGIVAISIVFVSS